MAKYKSGAGSKSGDFRGVQDQRPCSAPTSDSPGSYKSSYGADLGFEGVKDSRPGSSPRSESIKISGGD